MKVRDQANLFQVYGDAPGRAAASWPISRAFERGGWASHDRSAGDSFFVSRQCHREKPAFWLVLPEIWLLGLITVLTVLGPRFFENWRFRLSRSPGMGPEEYCAPANHYGWSTAAFF